MRVFTAVALPDSIKDQLVTLRQTRIPTARWEHHDDFHLTLRFIGDVDSDTYDRYKAALTTVKAAPFELVLQGVGRFPPQVKRPPNVLWVGVQLTPELTDLQAKVTSALEAEGLGKDKHGGYTPHITLARLRTTQPLDELDRFLTAHADFKTPAIPVTEFVMYQRDPIPGGASYKQISKFPLKQ